MSDPCEEEGLTCTYDTWCGPIATCQKGRWRLTPTSSGGCSNPPPVCPDEEPTDVETASCVHNIFQGGAHCRYARGGCFDYLACSPGQRWTFNPQENTCDGCCPQTPPAIGDLCEIPGALCPGALGDIFCEDGKWRARRHAGAGGAGGAAASGGAAGAGGSSGASLGGAAGAGGSSGAGLGGAAGAGGTIATACPEQQPLQGDPCTDGLSCGGYPHGFCSTVNASCVGGRWQTQWTPTAEGCSEVPACPTSEPDVDAPCAPGTGSGAWPACRYPQGTCFRYLECAEDGSRWRAPAYRLLDSCCPAARPALGSGCADEGARCSWAHVCDYYGERTELTCRLGVWADTPP